MMTGLMTMLLMQSVTSWALAVQERQIQRMSTVGRMTDTSGWMMFLVQVPDPGRTASTPLPTTVVTTRISSLHARETLMGAGEVLAPGVNAVQNVGEHSALARALATTLHL